MCGMALAFMGKMGVAVIVGKAISQLPPVLIAIVTSVSFVGVAIALWRKPITRKEAGKDHPAAPFLDLRLQDLPLAPRYA